MAFLDGTAVNVALPVIARELGIGFVGFQWIMGSYLVALSALVLTGGALADRWGARRALSLGIAAFALTSVACALAPELVTLVVARALQGIAAALLVPASLALAHTGFRPEDRGRAIGLWSGFSGVTTLVGPLVGGWLADTVTWRAVFLLNVPFAAAALLLALRAVPAGPPHGARRPPMDHQGSVTAAGALGGLVFALTQGPTWGWTHPAVLAAGALAVLSALGFVDAERSHASPLLPLDVFRRRAFLGANGVTLGVYFALSGVFFLLAIQLQRVLGYSALEAGAASAPVTLLLLALSPEVGRRAGQWGTAPFLVAGPSVAAVGCLLLSGVDRGDTYVAGVLPAIVVFGLGLSLTVAPVTSAALDALEERRSGVASGVNNAVARTAQLLAVPVLPLLAGLSGIEEVGGAAFSRGFGAACLWAAGVLAASAVYAGVVLGVRGRPRGGASRRG
jgi:EmrB/QacA subfamily drug resistance transporter